MLVFCDSFDHYSAAQMTRKWTTVGSGTISAARTGNGFSSSSPLNYPTKTFNAKYPTLTLGMAYKVFAFPTNIIIRFQSVGGPALNLIHHGDGKLKFRVDLVGAADAYSPTTTWVMNTGVWYYIEMQATISTVAPPHIVASARVNGTEILAWDYTGSGVTAAFDNISFQTGQIDDLYVTDGEFLGDVRIGVLYPNAAGDSAAWTPTPAGNNWEKVKEHPADDDTSYVSAGSVGLKDLYHLDDIDPAFAGEIKGVQALWLTKKSDEGEGAVKGVWKSGASEIVQASGHNYLAPNGYHSSAASYIYNIQTERNSLFTASPWTVSEINSLMLGITRTL